MTDELKPFRCGCGGEAEVGEVHFWGRCYTVQCSECGIETKPHPTEAEAVQAWNRAMGKFPKTDIRKIDSVRPTKCEYGDGNVTFASGYICPNCYSNVRERDNYCCGCGMRLEWKHEDAG